MRQGDDYSVSLIDLPSRIKGLVSIGDDGWPHIFLNARLSREEQQQALLHELRHIERDDAFNSTDIRIAESI